jgi:cobalamin biosynthesis Mg chelatase CobN
LRIIEEAGFDNYVVEREDDDEGHEQFIAHVSFLITYHSPAGWLGKVAEDLDARLQYEDGGEGQHEGDDEAATAVARATTAPVQAAAAAGAAKRDRRAARSEAAGAQSGAQLVELRRRKRRNRAGHYVLAYELRPDGSSARRSGGAGIASRWVSVAEYDQRFQAGRVVEDSGFEEGV